MSLYDAWFVLFEHNQYSLRGLFDVSYLFNAVPLPSVIARNIKNTRKDTIIYYFQNKTIKYGPFATIFWFPWNKQHFTISIKTTRKLFGKRFRRIISAFPNNDDDVLYGILSCYC